MGRKDIRKKSKKVEAESFSAKTGFFLLTFGIKTDKFYNASGRSRQASPRAILSIASPVAFFLQMGV